MTETMTTFDAAMILDGEWDMTAHEANEDNFITACQRLIDTGLAWTLQGRVGRVCQQMIDAGVCNQREVAA